MASREEVQPQKILIVSANPKKTSPLRLDEELREIDEGLRRSKYRDQFVLESRLAARPRDLRRALLEESPSFVHFCGHGAGHSGIILEDIAGYLKLVEAKPLANLFKLFSQQIRCVVLNACYSEVQATEISQHIDYVVGMKQSIGDRSAIKFSTGFYDAIGAGRSIEDAFEFGKNAIELENISEDLIPALKKHARLLEKDSDITAPTKWAIVLSATIDDIDKPMAEAIISHLQKLSGDTNLTLKKIDSGSVILSLEGSEDGFIKIKRLLEAGELKSLNGFTVERVTRALESERNTPSIFSKVGERHSQRLEFSESQELEFAANLESRVPVILLLDKSGSMSGEPIAALMRGLQTFKETLRADPLAALRTEVAIITFNSRATITQDFVPIDGLTTPSIEASGSTSTGAAINLGLDLVAQRKSLYKANGILYYRPWLFMITDGIPTDSWQQAAQRVVEAESNNELSFFPVGVGNADMNVLKRMSSKPPMLLNGLDFPSMFSWLSSSLSLVSNSRVGELVPLPPVQWGRLLQ